MKINSRRRRPPSPAYIARRSAQLELLARQLEQHVIGEWHRRADRLAQADRYRAQAFRLGRYLPGEDRECDMPF
jgi:hypothetical protein